MKLSEIEEFILAICEGEFVDFATILTVLENWFSQDFSVSDIHTALDRIGRLRLIECRLGDSWTFSNLVPELVTIQRASFRTTLSGMQYVRRLQLQDE